MVFKTLATSVLLVFHVYLSAQSNTVQVNQASPYDSSSSKISRHTFNEQARPAIKKKVLLIAGVHTGLWTGSFLALNQAWYADYPRSSFHFFNDNSEWNQMDKAGHFWTSYQFSRVSTQMWKWSGVAARKSVILGSISGIAYQSIIEINDGFSNEWGFSLGDMTANLAGAAAFAFQELAWHDQRLQVKFSYSPYNYSGDVVSRKNQLFGKGNMEPILKDYNAQTYWISGNLGAFMPAVRLPAWLNISVGYGAEGMLGGTLNQWRDESGMLHNRPDIIRTRRFFISPDIDLTRIRTRSKLLHSVFFALNMIKFPAPALELNSRGKFRAHLVYF